jgi:hypothetical protein
MKRIGWIATAALVTSAATPALGQDAVATRAYHFDAIAQSGLGPQATTRRTGQLASLCPTPTPVSAAETAAVVGALVMAGFKLVSGLVRRAIDKGMAQKIASLANTDAGVISGDDHPLGAAAPRCAVIERSSEAGDEMVVAVRLERVGDTAMIARVVHASLPKSSVWSSARLEEADVTLTLGMRSIVSAANAGSPSYFDVPAWQVGLGRLGPGRAAAALPASGVLPMRTGAPTSLSLAVTEVHPTLDDVRARQALADGVLDDVFNAFGAAVGRKLEEKDD